LINFQLTGWSLKNGTGTSATTDGGFLLANGAIRGPDACWVRNERLREVSKDSREGFLPLCPDFVIEVRSPTDRLAPLQKKMDEWIDNGAALGWLIEPWARRIHVYRPGKPAEIHQNPSTISAEPELPEFTFNLAKIWDPTID
jgi:Uma2 family endonuclease